MSSKRDSLAPLRSRIGQAMLLSKNVARIGYLAPDGTPRVTPVWFHWNGSEIVIISERNFKVKSIQLKPDVAISIDDNAVPFGGLQVRGTATIEELGEFVPELEEMAVRYLGEEQGRKYCTWVEQNYSLTVRISIQPEWAGVTDYEDEFRRAFSA